MKQFADAATRQGFPPPEVIPHGVAPATQPRVGGGPFVFIGTLAYHKGPDRVRAAWLEAGAPIGLRLYGPPGSDPAFIIENDGLLPRDGVSGVLSHATALILGSRWPENAPLVILEARAAGCPVIAPAIGGIPELLEAGVDGWLYDPNTRGALARAIAEAACTQRTPRLPPTFSDHLRAIEQLYTRVLR